MRELEGRVAVVTGAASGIGCALAVRFAAEGMSVVLADINGEGLRQTERTIGASALAQVTDVSDEQSVEVLADRAYQELGAVHVLCNNAGVAPAQPGQVWEIPTAEWRRILGVNLFGAVHGLRAFVPRMIAQGGDAHIVNTASLAGLVTFPGITAYGASKHAVVALSEQLALELRERAPGIGVSVLCPGLVNTPMTQPPAEIESEGVADDLIRVMTGMEPEVVADHVVRAIREERFTVLTHPEWRDAIRARCETILAGSAPVMPEETS